MEVYTKSNALFQRFIQNRLFVNAGKTQLIGFGMNKPSSLQMKDYNFLVGEMIVAQLAELTSRGYY